MSNDSDFETPVLDCLEKIGERITILHKMLLLVISTDERAFTESHRRIIMEKAASLVDNYDEM